MLTPSLSVVNASAGIAAKKCTKPELRLAIWPNLGVILVLRDQDGLMFGLFGFTQEHLSAERNLGSSDKSIPIASV